VSPNLRLKVSPLSFILGDTFNLKNRDTLMRDFANGTQLQRFYFLWAQNILHILIFWRH